MDVLIVNSTSTYGANATVVVVLSAPALRRNGFCVTPVFPLFGLSYMYTSTRM